MIHTFLRARGINLLFAHEYFSQPHNKPSTVVSLLLINITLFEGFFLGIGRKHVFMSIVNNGDCEIAALFSRLWLAAETMV